LLNLEMKPPPSCLSRARGQALSPLLRCSMIVAKMHGMVSLRADSRPNTIVKRFDRYVETAPL